MFTTLYYIGTLLCSSLVELSHAAVPDTPCGDLPGCGAGPSNIILNNAPKVAGLGIAIAAGGAVLFIAWAGFQMVLAAGDEGKIGEQKKAILHALIGLGIAILAQGIVSIVGTQNYGQEQGPSGLPANIIASAIGIILTVFNVVFIVVVIYAGMRMVYAQGKSDEFSNGRKMITWCIVGAIVTNLANALVQAFVAIFGV